MSSLSRCPLPGRAKLTILGTLGWLVSWALPMYKEIRYLKTSCVARSNFWGAKQGCKREGTRGKKGVASRAKVQYGGSARGRGV